MADSEDVKDAFEDLMWEIKWHDIYEACHAGHTYNLQFKLDADGNMGVKHQ